MAVYQLDRTLSSKNAMRDALAALGLIASHLDALDTGALSIVIKGGRFELTTENPLDKGVPEHLGLTEV